MEGWLADEERPEGVWKYVLSWDQPKSQDFSGLYSNLYIQVWQVWQSRDGGVELQQKGLQYKVPQV